MNIFISVCLIQTKDLNHLLPSIDRHSKQPRELFNQPKTHSIIAHRLIWSHDCCNARQIAQHSRCACIHNAHTRTPKTRRANRDHLHPIRSAKNPKKPTQSKVGDRPCGNASLYHNQAQHDQLNPDQNRTR